ncbi:MAG: hypothetical protein WA621_00365 [Candidatus Acidiferrum sp.]|jgi:hypothetical protein
MLDLEGTVNSEGLLRREEMEMNGAVKPGEPGTTLRIRIRKPRGKTPAQKVESLAGEVEEKIDGEKAEC